jgi:hypothetical protein
MSGRPRSMTAQSKESDFRTSIASAPLPTELQVDIFAADELFNAQSLSLVILDDQETPRVPRSRNDQMLSIDSLTFSWLAGFLS